MFITLVKSVWKLFDSEVAKNPFQFAQIDHILESDVTARRHHRVDVSVHNYTAGASSVSVIPTHMLRIFDLI